MNLNTDIGDRERPKYNHPQIPEDLPEGTYTPVKKILNLTLELKAVLLQFQMVNNNLKTIQKQIDILNQLATTESILYYLRQLKTLFERLQEEDLSQNIDYALELSNAWHGVTDHFAVMNKSARKSDFYKEGSLLIESITHYPPQDEHSLGYYLFHYAGENWLPFPFMKIIQSLHEEHANDKTGSHLEIWSKSIVQLIEIFTRSILSSPQVG